MAILPLTSSVLVGGQNKSRRFEVVYDFDVRYDQKSYPARLWNPLPYNAPYQKVRYLSFGGDYDGFDINSKNPYDARIFMLCGKKPVRKKAIYKNGDRDLGYRCRFGAN